jgi:hypothetical protein
MPFLRHRLKDFHGLLHHCRHNGRRSVLPWWLYVRIKRWMDRDLALSLAGKDEQKRAFMLDQLALAQAQKIKRQDLPQWLEAAAAGYLAR